MTLDVRVELDRAAERLTAAGVESGRSDAEVLLAHVLGTPRNRLHAAGPLTAAQWSDFADAVTRRATREPLQHITGRAAFRHAELEVGPGVFVPRPETEVLADAAIDELRAVILAGNPRPFAVDLCTGSGAVAVAMATEVTGCQVVAIELSADAAAYAERNAAGLDVEVRCGDIASAADDLTGRAAVVTANPPYIPLSAYESVAAEARDHDPPLALWAAGDGLGTIRAVAEVAARLLVDGGLVLCEHADVQGECAPAVFAAAGAWTQVRDRRDLNGRPRFVTARRTVRGPGERATPPNPQVRLAP